MRLIWILKNVNLFVTAHKTQNKKKIHVVDNNKLLKVANISVNLCEKFDEMKMIFTKAVKQKLSFMT